MGVRGEAVCGEGRKWRAAGEALLGTTFPVGPQAGPAFPRPERGVPAEVLSCRVWEGRGGKVHPWRGAGCPTPWREEGLERVGNGGPRRRRGPGARGKAGVTYLVPAAWAAASSGLVGRRREAGPGLAARRGAAAGGGGAVVGA